MGCWNNTCGLTNLPILVGDPVYIFPIIETIKAHRSHCYASALYRPSYIPFEGKYNDYGAAEECHGLAFIPIIEHLKEWLTEVEQGDNQYHDIAVKRADFDVDLFFDAIHKHRLQVNGNNVYFTMIHKSILDKLWNDNVVQFWTGKGKGREPDSYYDYMTYSELATQIPEFLEKCKKENTRRYFRFVESDQVVSMYFRDHSTEAWDLIFLQNTIGDLISLNKEHLAIGLMELRLKGMMVNNIMERTRKVWLPVMHQGSQDQDYDMYKTLNKITNEHIAEREEEFGVYDDA